MPDPAAPQPDDPVPFLTCGHPPGSVQPGPRVPHRWGSGPTEVCRDCGGWRSVLHRPGPWWPGPVERESEDDDGR